MNTDVSKLPDAGTLISYGFMGFERTGVIVSYEFVSLFFHGAPWWYVNILLEDCELIRMRTNSWMWINNVNFLEKRI